MLKMKSSFYITVGLIAMGLICFGIFAAMGSTIDSEGILHEPFFLIPVGYLFILSGLISGAIYLIKNIVNKRSSKQN